MQRKAYVFGVAALLVATVTLAGCTGSDGGEEPPDSKQDGSGTTASAAEPGRYRTLPEPCGAVERGTLDSLLPGLKQVTDAEQREEAYAGAPTLTYDTDRKVGCRWTAEAASATDRLWVDFDRVTAYENAVSDDSRASELYAAKEEVADLPVPVPSESASPTTTPSADESGASDEAADEATGGAAGDTAGDPSGDATGGADDGADDGDGGAPAPTDDPSATSSSTPSPSETPAALQPRTLDDLGDEAFLDDALSASRQRTVTVVFRTSNVIVTIRYDEQPTSATDVPSSEDMQKKVRELAGRLDDTLNE
ncbi:DUF3558 domain-containing protein [Streptomyces flaveus]|uniref:DUF3558 domain-containing protein n=1 Tax=Streptomyces flaveus TaxID=66370 RepID=A0A917RCK2_9ACTN|nr:DUF3558 domain-containing protein [Streptomyces flaveus]GGL00209.1 hypothetical protein GCM10010094_71100 [Streptomyces flaveus]